MDDAFVTRKSLAFRYLDYTTFRYLDYTTIFYLLKRSAMLTRSTNYIFNDLHCLYSTVTLASMWST